MAKTTRTLQGDTWDILAMRELGDEGYMSLLIIANPAHRLTTIFSANVEIIVPDIPSSKVATNLPPWVRS